MIEQRETQVMRGRPVTDEEADESVHRLVATMFNSTPRARASIPVQAHDDDVLLTDYIREQRAQLSEALSQRQAALEAQALQRKQLRNAWAKLRCRCIFNDEDEKVAEDSHCPYHGWQQRDTDEWDPIGDLEQQLKTALEEVEKLRSQLKLKEIA